MQILTQTRHGSSFFLSGLKRQWDSSWHFCSEVLENFFGHAGAKLHAIDPRMRVVVLSGGCLSDGSAKELIDVRIETASDGVKELGRLEAPELVLTKDRCGW